MRHKPPKRRVSCATRTGKTDATRKNQIWSMGFVTDQLHTGQRLQLLTTVDNFTRVNPMIWVGFNYKGTDVVSASLK